MVQHIVRRIQEIGRSYRLRVLLVLADDEHNLPALQELNKIAFVSEFTLLVAWSNLECARYLETLKLYEGKSAASIQQKEETEFTPRMAAVLTQVRSVNKSDVVTLLDMCGSLAGICAASEQRLQLCPGVGDKKVKRLRAALHQPFIRRQRQRRDDEGAAAATGASAAPDTAASHCSGNQQDDAQASAAEEEERNGVTASVTAPSIATMVYNCDHSHPPRPTVAVAVADAAVDGFEGAQRRVDTND